MQACEHIAHEGEKFKFEVPYLGTVIVCGECRRELGMRTMERPVMVVADCGRFGYQCSKCDGEFTSTDAVTCKCPGRKEACEINGKALDQWLVWNRIVHWKANEPALLPELSAGLTEATVVS